MLALRRSPASESVHQSPARSALLHSGCHSVSHPPAARPLHTATPPTAGYSWTTTGPCGISSTWRSPTARHPGRSLSPFRRPILKSLRPGCRVVALGEVDEMPHPLHPIRRSAVQPGHLGDLPARRGHQPLDTLSRHALLGDYGPDDTDQAPIASRRGGVDRA